MKLDRFDPPGDLTDFDGIPKQREAWSEAMSFWFDEGVERTEQFVGAGNSQYYNPTVVATDPPSSERVISWVAFPQRIAQNHPGDQDAARQEAEQLLTHPQVSQISFRPQDEYCEWFATRDPLTQKIVRVSFTCEGPEYWAALAHGYPRRAFLEDEGYNGPTTAGAVGDQSKLLALYREHVSPDVQLADLFFNGLYNPWNKWNTTHGAMHLTHTANTLQAEIYLGADATVLRARGGTLLTNQQELICCAGYGAPLRASDPTIGGGVNALARSGASITLRNPVGLYLGRPNTAGWTKPDGSPVGDYWRVVRGADGMAVRAVYEVPASEGFAVGDIRIGGEPIRFGGQITEHLEIRLTGVACRVGQSANQPVGCETEPPPGCPAFVVAAQEALSPEETAPHLLSPRLQGLQFAASTDEES